MKDVQFNFERMVSWTQQRYDLCLSLIIMKTMKISFSSQSNKVFKVKNSSSVPISVSGDNRYLCLFYVPYLFWSIFRIYTLHAYLLSIDTRRDHKKVQFFTAKNSSFSYFYLPELLLMKWNMFENQKLWLQRIPVLAWHHYALQLAHLHLSPGPLQQWSEGDQGEVFP